MAAWTEQVEEQLINLVQGYPWLYDAKHRGHRDKHKKSNSWREISTNLGHGVDAEAAQKKWDSLRDKYRRLRQKEARPTPSGSGLRESESERITWPFYTVLHAFLQQHTNHRRRGGDSFTMGATAESETQSDTGEHVNDGSGQNLSQVLVNGCFEPETIIFEDCPESEESERIEGASRSDGQQERAAATDSAERRTGEAVNGAAVEPAPLETPQTPATSASPTPGPSNQDAALRRLATPRRPQAFKRPAASREPWQMELIDAWKKSNTAAEKKDRIGCFVEYLGTRMRNLSPQDLDDVEEEMLRVVRRRTAI